MFTPIMSQVSISRKSMYRMLPALSSSVRVVTKSLYTGTAATRRWKLSASSMMRRTSAASCTSCASTSISIRLSRTTLYRSFTVPR